MATPAGLRKPNEDEFGIVPRFEAEKCLAAR
jgi:hypothetical protein